MLFNDRKSDKKVRLLITRITKLFFLTFFRGVFLTRFCVQTSGTVWHHRYTRKNTKNLTLTVREFNKRIVYPDEDCKDINTAEDTKKRLMSKSPADYGIRVDRIAPIKKNGILLESRSESILNLDSNVALKELLNLVGKPIGKSWPKIQIFDLPVTQTKEDIIMMLKNQSLPAGVPDEFVRTAFRISNPSKRSSADITSWIVELHPLAWSYLTKAGKVYFGWKVHNVRDYMRISRCYKCQKFGHIAKHCTAQKHCGYCSSADHQSRECPNAKDPEAYTCVNCARLGKTGQKHHTGDITCPVYLKRLQDAIDSTEYTFDG